MQLPFTVEQFFEVFGEYNSFVWPAQIVLACLALVALALVFVPRRWAGAGVSAILALLWTWSGIAYHLVFFSRINPLAYVFSAVSLLGAFAFLWQGVIQKKLQFAWVMGIRALLGSSLVIFSLVLYPIWSAYDNHRYPEMPTFGLPCPTTIFTIGLLAFLVPPYPGSPLLIPILWCFVGAQAAVLLGVHQDIALVAAGLVGALLLSQKKVSSSSTGPVT